MQLRRPTKPKERLEYNTSMKKLLSAGSFAICKAGRFLAQVRQRSLERTQEYFSVDPYDVIYAWFKRRMKRKNRSKNEENKPEK